MLAHVPTHTYTRAWLTGTQHTCMADWTAPTPFRCPFISDHYGIDDSNDDRWGERRRGGEGRHLAGKDESVGTDAAVESAIGSVSKDVRYLVPPTEVKVHSGLSAKGDADADSEMYAELHMKLLASVNATANADSSGGDHAAAIAIDSASGSTNANANATSVAVLRTIHTSAIGLDVLSSATPNGIIDYDVDMIEAGNGYFVIETSTTSFERTVVTRTHSRGRTKKRPHDPQDTATGEDRERRRSRKQKRGSRATSSHKAKSKKHRCVPDRKSLLLF